MPGAHPCANPPQGWPAPARRWPAFRHPLPFGGSVTFTMPALRPARAAEPRYLRRTRHADGRGVGKNAARSQALRDQACQSGLVFACGRITRSARPTEAEAEATCRELAAKKQLKDGVGVEDCVRALRS